MSRDDLIKKLRTAVTGGQREGAYIKLCADAADALAGATEQKSPEMVNALTEAIGHLALGIKELRDAGHTVPVELYRAMRAANYALSEEIEK
jgi:hypothetical protein